MATKGFRRSFLGFNKEDVLNYIASEDKKNASIVKSLNGEVKELTQRTINLNNEIDKLNIQLQKYKDKEDEINRLAESIGALYIIAKNNAEIILDNASKSKEAATAEIEKNLEILNAAQENYVNIKSEILNITSNFSNNLDSALHTIKTTEEVIKDNLKEAETAEKVLKETLK